MKITRRLLGGVFAAALASISFSQVTFAGTAQELGAESVIETIKKRGVIKIGLDLFVPWSMRDKNGDLVGFQRPCLLLIYDQHHVQNQLNLHFYPSLTKAQISLSQS